MMIYFIISNDAAFFQHSLHAKGCKSKKLRFMKPVSPGSMKHSLSLSAMPIASFKSVIILFFLALAQAGNGKLSIIK